MAPKLNADAFTMPGLTALDPDYAAAVSKYAELSDALSVLTQKQRVAEADVLRAQALAPAVSAAVANLIGDPATTTLRQHRETLAAVRRQIGDHQSAMQILSTRIRTLAERAGRTLVERVRPEFGRRVAKLVDVLLEVEKARADVEQLRNDVEREGASSGALIADLHFLGEFNHRDGTSYHIRRVEQQARSSNSVG